MEIEEEEPTTSTSTPPKASMKKRRRQRKRKNQDDEEYQENKSVANQINQKFGGSKEKHKDETPMFEVRNGKATIKNSGNHRLTVSRTLDTHMNKMFQWEEEPEAIESSYNCALCHEQGLKRELFGPYYISLNPAKHWPNFLAKKPTTKKPSYKIELWFHGTCILWAPNVNLHGSQLTNLDHQMDIFWSQNCAICRKTGAAISVQNKKNMHVHYPCAKNKGYKLDEHALVCNS